MPMKLIEILDGLDDQMLLNDGATTWTVENLKPEVREDDGEYTTRTTDDGRLQIVRLKPDGYMESVAAYDEAK